MGGFSPKRRKIVRAELFQQQGGKCCYCQRPMRIVDIQPGVRVPDDAATIEHPYQKGDPRRPKRHTIADVWLACWRCNWNRGRANPARLPDLKPKSCPQRVLTSVTEGHPGESVPLGCLNEMAVIAVFDGAGGGT